MQRALDRHPTATTIMAIPEQGGAHSGRRLQAVGGQWL
jgi:hypothetical protein